GRRAGRLPGAGPPRRHHRLDQRRSARPGAARGGRAGAARSPDDRDRRPLPDPARRPAPPARRAQRAGAAAAGAGGGGAGPPAVVAGRRLGRSPRARRARSSRYEVRGPGSAIAGVSPFSDSPSPDWGGWRRNSDSVMVASTSTMITNTATPSPRRGVSSSAGT